MYIACMIEAATGFRVARNDWFFAPSHRLRRLAYTGYGFGHTCLREPGDLRGTVVGRQGRWRSPALVKGGED